MNQIIETKKEIKETTPTAEYFFPEPVDGYCFSHLQRMSCQINRQRTQNWI